MKVLVVALMGLLIATTGANAAFMVQIDTDGSNTGAGAVPGPNVALNPNFSFGGDTTSATASIRGFAVGTNNGNSIYGGNGVAAFDTYVYKYTPGTNADNVTFTNGQILGSSTGFPGNGETATGFTGGPSGLYNVYVTIPQTTNVSAGAMYTLSQDGADVVVGPLNQNNGGTGLDTDPGTGFVGGMNDAWYKLGQVNLVSGNTYTITQQTTNNTFVSMRGFAVMWERVVPEPSTFALLSLACAGMVCVRRRVG